jgi:uncharacterized protein (DUF1697 family)
MAQICHEHDTIACWLFGSGYDARMAIASRRYVAFLRGVSPMNCKMAELKSALERAGFEDVKTVLSSGNAVFNARAKSEAALAKQAEASMKKYLGRSFFTLVRSVASLEKMLTANPFGSFRLTASTKRVITFLGAPPTPKPNLPIALSDARILRLDGDTVFSAYVPGPKGPVFMALIEKTFGKNITTRTWDTVAKCAKS